jgi:DNA repair photolyase
MALNKQKGNMYPFVTHTWNPIKGECSHDCQYCFMKVYKQKPLHFVEEELKDDLGEGNYIFVGSSTDMFASEVPHEWIVKVLNKCKSHDKNTYLFQSKNPIRLLDFFSSHDFPTKTILGTTLETNRNYHISKAPTTTERSRVMNFISSYDKMISIEPIMDFDLEEFVMIIRGCKPKFVSIGADSKGHHLPEPSYEKICGLIRELEKFTEVRVKSNLKRLVKP